MSNDEDRAFEQMKKLIEDITPEGVMESSGITPNDIAQLLQKALKGPPAAPADDQKKALKAFIDAGLPSFTVGDIVKPNVSGDQRYQIQKETIVMISAVFEPPIRDDVGDPLHGEIIMMNNRTKAVVSRSVDFRYFEKA